MSSHLPCWCVTILAESIETKEQWNVVYELHDSRAWSAKTRAHLEFIHDHQDKFVSFLGSHVEIKSTITEP